jgi:hypothetical protein
MRQSEVGRHMTHDHQVPVSPFEETFSSEASKTNNTNDNKRIAARQIRKVTFRTFGY